MEGEIGKRSSPLPSLPDHAEPQNANPCRLWVGNLDPKLTEFSLLKIVQQFGTLKQYDFLYHKAGPDMGKSRGYCFVTYNTPQEARKAQQNLHGKKVLSKHIIVKQAHSEREEEVKPAAKSEQQSSQGSSSISKSTQIAAIEAKLRLMAQDEDVTSFLPKTKNVSSQQQSTSSTANNPTDTQGISKLAQAALASGVKPGGYKSKSGHSKSKQFRPYTYR